MALDHSPYDQVFSNEKTHHSRPGRHLQVGLHSSCNGSQGFGQVKALSPFLQVWKRTDRVGARRISGLLVSPWKYPNLYFYIYVGYEGHLRIIFPKIPGTSKQHGFFVAREGPWTLGGGSPPSSGNPTCHPHIMEVSKNCHSNAPAEN